MTDGPSDDGGGVANGPIDSPATPSADRSPAPAPQERSSDRAVDASAARATVIFLAAVILLLAAMLLGSAYEIHRFPESEENKHIFNFMIQFAAAFGGSGSVALEAVLAVLSLYMVNGLSPRSWNLLAYGALAAMLGAVVVTIRIASNDFAESFCDFPYVGGELPMPLAGVDLIECSDWDGTKTMLGRLRAFVSFAIGANFVIFLALLKQDATQDFLRKTLKKLGIDGGDS